MKIPYIQTLTCFWCNHARSTECTPQHTT